MLVILKPQIATTEAFKPMKQIMKCSHRRLAPELRVNEMFRVSSRSIGTE